MRPPTVVPPVLRCYASYMERTRYVTHRATYHGADGDGASCGERPHASGAGAGAACRVGGRVRYRLLAALVAVVLSACASGGPEGYAAPQPRDGRAGLWLTGTVGGRQVAVSDGSPDLFLGNCGPGGDGDADLCFSGRDIDGGVVVVIVRNPDVLEAGETVSVGEDAIVDVRLGDAPLRRARGGRLDLRVVRTASRYAGSLNLEFRDGRLTGDFDVVPRRE